MGAGIVVLQYVYILGAMFSVMNQRYDEEEEVVPSQKRRKTGNKDIAGEPKKPKNMALAVQDLQDNLAHKGSKLEDSIKRLGHHAVCLQFMLACF